MLPENATESEVSLFKKEPKTIEEKIKQEKFSESTNCMSTKTQPKLNQIKVKGLRSPIAEIEETDEEPLMTKEALCKYEKESKNSAISNISNFNNRIINELPYKSQMLFYDNVNNEVEFKICNVKKNENKNYYQPNEFLMVKLPSVKEEDNKVFYYIDDDDDCNNNLCNNKKVYKSIVISSTKKMKENEQNKNKPYIWDNYKKYFQMNSKGGTTSGGKNMLELVKNHILKAIFSRFSKQSITKGGLVFISTLIVQVILSRKIRSFSKSYLTMLLSTIVSSGLSYLVISKLTNRENKEIGENKEKKKIIK